MSTKTLTREIPVRHRGDGCCETAQSPSMTVGESDRLASRLKALGDPTRLRMLDLLAQQDEPLCVCDMTPRFAQNQPTISHHLRLLREAGFIATEKRGIWSYYWATTEGRKTLQLARTVA